MSTIHPSGNVWISQNYAIVGAGALFDCYQSCSKELRVSYIILASGSNLHIQDNKARDYGGGLMIRSQCSRCFIQSTSNYSDSVSSNENALPQIQMSGNRAGIAGDSIYGGDLENCFFESTGTPIRPKIFWSFLSITERASSPSAVASPSYRVCICDENFTTHHNCFFHVNIEVYPGQIFHIPVVGVGQYNYSSPSVIRAIIPSGVKLGDQQVTQEVKLLCTNLPYSLRTHKDSVMIKLFIEVPFSYSSTPPKLEHATVNVTILNCPFGFELRNEICDCQHHILSKGLVCNIFNQAIQKPGRIWIGNFSEHHDIVIHNHCPFDYCNQSVLEIKLTRQDDQCNSNRSGVLCGGCRDGLGIMLGTSKCQKCSNVYLLLLLPISFAGLCLVVLLLKCNLTVSIGTLNGLIFYANIVQVNSKVFFSTHPTGNMSTISGILSVFIAWINLDLGIEVCFAENLNTFSRAWLQFTFPIYIWCIIGLLIIVCRYSTTVSRLTGSNTVSVLATLFLLSYAKLLRTTLDAFSPITITDPNNTDHLRWLLDGNYGFLQWPHLAIFLVALLVLVTHLLPFTALLLLGPTLQAHTNHRALRWVTRIKPFLDAYHGPYKTKYRYWTGFMLLVRVFLFSVFAGNALGDPNVNLLTILITLLLLLMMWIQIGRIYRKSPINALELFFLLNLAIFASATLYLRASGNTGTQQQTLSLVSVGSALLVFMAVLVYHCYSQLARMNIVKKLIERLHTVWPWKIHRDYSADQNEGVPEPQVRVSSPTRSEVSLKELLLEDTN